MAPSAPESAANDGISLYRSTFVGRESELQQLRLAFEAAAEGQGGLIVIVGEPGIGKTALWQQLAEDVNSQGARVLVGHCYEEGSRTTPYQPFVEALQPCVQTSAPDELREDLGSGGADAGRIFPEILDRLQLTLPPPGSAEEEQWRLLHAVGTFLLNTAKRRPVLLVLEDLHGADRASLDQLVHLSRYLATSHLLMVGTYRDVEVDGAHPLSSALAELRRSAHFRRMALRGLTVDDVRRWWLLTAGKPVARAQAEAIYQRTEGNPLFVQEVIRNTLELRRLAGQNPDDVPQLDALAANDMPEGLRDVVGKRLNRLTETTNRVLTIAAVTGREFRLDVLQRVADLNEDDLLQALEEAQKHAIIEERGLTTGSVVFRFCHAFYRQALYEEIFAPRRVRLHQRVAHTLEEVHVGHLDRHAAELADHFAHSSDSTEFAKAVHYAEVAASYAMSVFAYSEAEHYLRRALSAQEVVDSDNVEKRCDLLLALSEAMLPQQQPRRVTQTVAAEAFALAEALNDSPRAARAAMLALEPLIRVVAVTRLVTIPEFPEWAARLDRYALEGTVERVFADIWLGVQLLNTGHIGLGSARIRNALANAQQVRDDQARTGAVQFALPFLQSVQDIDLVDRHVQLLQSRPLSGPYAASASRGHLNLGERLLGLGDRTSAEREWRILAQLADHSRDASVAVRTREAEAARAYIDGDLEKAIELTDAAAREIRELDRYQIPQVYEVGIRASFELGRLSDDHLLPLEVGARQAQALRAVTLALLGGCQEAQDVRAQFGQVGGADDYSAVFNLLCLLEVSTRCHDRETAARLVAKLSPLAGRLSRAVSYGRLIGRAAALLGRNEEASDYYQAALDVCQRVRFRPELALVRLQVAELILDHFPERRTEALEHLEVAMPELSAMHMQPSLERAQRLARNVAAKHKIAAEAPNSTQQESTRTHARGQFTYTAGNELTMRERDVARLVSDGLTNREIAERLVISETTVEVHVKHILSKLGFKSRSQVAVWVSQQGSF